MMKKWQMSPRGENWNKRRSVPKNQFRERDTSLGRRVNDIRNDARPALGKYECDMVDKEAAWQDYKKMDNAIAWRCLVQVTLLESQNPQWGAIDVAVRRYKRWTSAEHLGGRRYERDQEVRQLRKKRKLHEKSIEKQTEEEMDTDVEWEPLGMILDENRSEKDQKDRVIREIAGR